MNDQAATIPIISSIADLAAHHPAWLVDVWGVIHNGVVQFGRAVEACQRHRRHGGVVVLITNAPRPSSAVIQQLDRIGVASDAYDDIVTSGDVAREMIMEWKHRAIHHLGPDRDLPLFAELGITFKAAPEADLIVCTGLQNDEIETPDDYAERLDGFLKSGATMICANPDIRVERGNKVVYCAGAVGQAYAALGGKVVYAGKPHASIYDLARRTAEAVAGRSFATAELLAIGDGLLTDIKGAHDQGIPSVYVASAVSLVGDRLTDDALVETFQGAAGRPVAAMQGLAW